MNGARRHRCWLAWICSWCFLDMLQRGNVLYRLLDHVPEASPMSATRSRRHRQQARRPGRPLTEFRRLRRCIFDPAGGRAVSSSWCCCSSPPSPWLATHRPYCPAWLRRLAAPNGNFWVRRRRARTRHLFAHPGASRLPPRPCSIVLALVIVTCAPIGLSSVRSRATPTTARIDRHLHARHRLSFRRTKLLLARPSSRRPRPRHRQRRYRGTTLTAWPPLCAAGARRGADYPQFRLCQRSRLAGASESRSCFCTSSRCVHLGPSSA